MQNLFSHRFSENIWRILPDADPESTLWVIELRDADTKSVSFALVDVAVPALIWHRKIEGTDWWTSLTAFAYGCIYFHHYRYPELPEPTDLLAVDAGTGAIKWELPHFILVRPIDADRLEVATKSGGDQLKKMICLASSGRLETMSDLETGESPDRIILKEAVRYREGNVYFDQLSLFIGEMVPGHRPAGIDYLEKRPYIIFSYYIYDQDKTVQYLLIVNDQRQLVLHEKLSDGREGMGRSTMMLKASTLVYLRNNNEYSSLTLS
nr:DUF4905 domain-containing protein [uncultured Dyadobacter sp.]